MGGGFDRTFCVDMGHSLAEFVSKKQGIDVCFDFLQPLFKLKERVWDVGVQKHILRHEVVVIVATLRDFLMI